MKIIIVGGFLGSGKTTVINKLIRGIVEDGQFVAIIENEIGSTAIDNIVLEQADVQVTPLFGGCVCCQITGHLVSALEQIQRDVNPDWIITEMTGLALMNDIRTTIYKYGNLGAEIHTISIVDMSRFDILVRAMRNVIEHQIEGADIVLANKTDISPLTEEARKTINEFSRGAHCFPISATSSDHDVWDIIKKGVSFDVES